MRTPSRRLTATVLGVGLLLSGACGGDDGGDETTKTTTTTEAAASTTTAGTDAGSTTTADEGSTTTAEDGGTTTVPDTSGEPAEGTGAPDVEAPNVDWDLNPAEYRGRDGMRVAFLCPPDAPDTQGSVWGTDTYTDDSSVCWSAVHQGIIDTEEGGRVVIEVAPGQDAYEGSEANGVTANDYGNWSGSFTFPPS